MKNRYIYIFITLVTFSSLYSQSGLSVHGYLNQAFAFTDGNQIFGIPENGTTDYRNLALQFRYDLNEESNFVIQLSHKRAGLNPLMAIEEDIKLDWGYFEYHFNDILSSKVGKIQIPLGNYNEYRDVGVLHPFYNVPFSPYGEGNYMSETMDGLLISLETEMPENWMVDIDLYGGHWNWREWVIRRFPGGGLEEFTGIINIENGIGGRLRLLTPYEGLEFSLGGQYAEPYGGLSFVKNGYFGKKMELYDIFFSVKGEFQHFFVGMDYLYARFLDHPANPQTFNSQVGIHLMNDLDINFQYEQFIIYKFTVPSYLIDLVNKNSIDIHYNKDYAVGLKYRLSSNLIFKVETHFNEGYLIENIVVDPFFDEPAKTQYTIISVATSF